MANKRRTWWLSCIGTLPPEQAGVPTGRHTKDRTPVYAGLAKSGAQGPARPRGLGEGVGLDVGTAGLVLVLALD